MIIKPRRIGWPFIVLGAVLLASAGMLLRESRAKLRQARQIARSLHRQFAAESSACGFREGLGEKDFRAYLDCMDKALKAKAAAR